MSGLKPCQCGYGPNWYYAGRGKQQALQDAADWIKQELKNEQLGLFGGAA